MYLVSDRILTCYLRLIRYEFDFFKSAQEESNFRAKPILSWAHLMPKMWYRAKLNVSTTNYFTPLSTINVTQSQNEDVDVNLTIKSWQPARYIHMKASRSLPCWKILRRCHFVQIEKITVPGLSCSPPYDITWGGKELSYWCRGLLCTLHSTQRHTWLCADSIAFSLFVEVLFGFGKHQTRRIK